MSGERWQRIEQLYHSALGRGSAERAAYLAAECAGDEELRREIESLISNGREVFLERPALEVAAEQYRSALSQDLTGRDLGRYESLWRLGVGGMGEVYRAWDTRLKRHVALKVLPPEWMADPDRKRRLELEARATSALNHPNIVTIFDIDQVDGIDFIAMEYVPGNTVDRLLRPEGLSIPEALSYAIQIAEALAAAHAAGIVHRDVKPSNLMVTGTGQVKILDFGLAKLVPSAAATGEGPTVYPIALTEEGTVVGTVSYMSPEQAQGKSIDSRSDIFSFGSVLYEMVTGRRAFQGDSKASTLAAIVEREPPPMRAGIPKELEEIASRCLCKDLAGRYQQMSHVRAALERLKQESQGSPPTRRFGRWWGIAAAAITVAVAGSVWWYGVSTKTSRPMEVVPLTSYPGYETYPSFSPDGNQVVFTWNGEKQDSHGIYVKRIGSSTPVRLTNSIRDRSPAFSPDGRSIGFIRLSERRDASFVVMPATGGPCRTVAQVLAPYINTINIAEQIPGPLFAWLPDGEHVVTDGLILLSVTTKEARKLTLGPPAGPDFSPSVSPDGHTVAFARPSGYSMSDIYRLDLNANLTPKGNPRRLTFQKGFNHNPVWSLDGRKIFFTSGGLETRNGLWSVAASGAGAPELVPIQDAWTCAISRDGNRLVYVRATGGEHIWRLSLRNSGQAVGPPAKFISSTRSEYLPQYSPDGKRIAFESDRGGNLGIWVCDADGSNSLELFSQPGVLAGSPRWAPDGKHLAFDSNAAGNMDIYAIASTGGAPVRLTHDPADDHVPSWSADGQMIYFASKRSGRFELWRAPAAGGEAVQVTRNGGWFGFESHDGRFVYYLKTPAGGGVWKMPVNGGAETLAVPSVAGWNYAVASQGIYFIDDAGGKPSIRFLDRPSGKMQVISSIPGWGDGLSVSPDGRSFLFVQVEAGGTDLMLVNYFSP